MNLMKRLVRHFWNNMLWLMSPRRFWAVTLTLIAASMLCAVLPLKLETSIRWAGLVLQAYGITVVMQGLVGRGKLFKMPNPIELARTWWNARPRWNPRPIDLTAHAVASAKGSASLTAGGRAVLPPGAPIEQRVELMERQIADIYAKVLPDIRKAQLESEQRLTTRVLEVKADGEKRAAEAEAKLREAAASDIPLEWVGVILLFVGVVASTIAPEVAGWFGAA